MLSYQGVALLEKVRWCGLVGRSVSLGLGVEVSKAQARFSGLFLVTADIQNSQLLLQHYVCQHAAMFLTMTTV